MCQLSKKEEIARSVPDPSPREGVGSGNKTNCHHAIMIDVQCHHSVAIVVMWHMIELIIIESVDSISRDGPDVTYT